VTFEKLVDQALEEIPAALSALMSNIELAIEDEPPEGDEDLLGLYEGTPLTERSGDYGFVLPDRITIFRGPLERLCGGDQGMLREEVRQTVLHEVAHHFGISDERLEELDRY
jgi:predicted Zn-dependent protease with MMP-like domain